VAEGDCKPIVQRRSRPLSGEGPEHVGGLLDARDVRRPGGGGVVAERIGVATALAVDTLAQDLRVARMLRGLGHAPGDQAAEGGWRVPSFHQWT